MCESTTFFIMLIYYYRIKIVKHQISLRNPGGSTHTSVTVMIFYSEKEFCFWLLNILEMWVAIDKINS